MGCSGITVGEVVFNTAMTGYQEILTDPSYAKQIVTLTCPHVGNTGINPEDMESKKTWLEGLVIRNFPLQYSNYRATQSLSDFLVAQQVVAIAEIDTRHLTTLLRDKGALNGALIAGPYADQMKEDDAVALARNCNSLEGADLASAVTTDSSYQWTAGSWQHDTGFRPTNNPDALVVVYDFGVKHNILRILADRGFGLQVVPATTTAEEVMAINPDGVMLSNGPGDPSACHYAIKATQALIAADIPIFGVCLGHQILALACGANTVKMPHGHHGSNHPVQDLASKKVLVTSQNHGFAVAAENLPETLEITHISLFDQTVQGIAHKTKPVFGFQGHPEASPGPHETGKVFDRFVEAARKRAEAKKEPTFA